MMQWQLEVERDGKVIRREEGFMADAYAQLIRAEDDTRAASKVTLSYGESTEFSRQKYNLSVTLTCDQNNKMLDRAYELAAKKIKELSEKVEQEFGG